MSVTEEFERLQHATASLHQNKRAGSPLNGQGLAGANMLDSASNQGPSNPDEARRLHDRTDRKVGSRPPRVSPLRPPNSHIPLAPSFHPFLGLGLISDFV